MIALNHSFRNRSFPYIKTRLKILTTPLSEIKTCNCLPVNYAVLFPYSRFSSSREKSPLLLFSELDTCTFSFVIKGVIIISGQSRLRIRNAFRMQFPFYLGHSPLANTPRQIESQSFVSGFVIKIQVVTDLDGGKSTNQSQVKQRQFLISSTTNERLLAVQIKDNKKVISFRALLLHIVLADRSDTES